MAQRDYVSRGRSGAARRKTPSRKKTSSPKVPKTLVTLAVALLVVFLGGLYFITHHKPEDGQLSPTHNTLPGNGLPPKPEERWRYIKELENRQIGVPSPTEPTAGGEVNSKAQLTDEQRQLLEQMQADMQQRPTQLSEVPYNDPAQPRSTDHQHMPPQMQQQPQSIQSPKPQAVTPPRTPEPKSQPQAETKPIVKPETAKQENKPETQQKWMVQCGSFHATDQAESVRAQLAFEGIESHITSGGGWHRVMLGPYGTRVAADKTLARLKNAGLLSCIPLATGG